MDLILEAGRISLHDVFLAHGSEANTSPRPRRGMTLRYMPTTSVFDRGIARRLADEKGIMDHTEAHPVPDAGAATLPAATISACAGSVPFTGTRG